MHNVPYDPAHWIKAHQDLDNSLIDRLVSMGVDWGHCLQDEEDPNRFTHQLINLLITNSFPSFFIATEKLPWDKELVLVVSSMQVGKRKVVKPPTLAIFTYAAGFTPMGSLVGCTVTHWMRLPDPSSIPAAEPFDIGHLQRTVDEEYVTHTRSRYMQ